MKSTASPESDHGGEPCAPERGHVSLASIERNALILALLLTAVSLMFGDRGISLGVALGGGLALLNYVWLKKFVQGIFLSRGGHFSKLSIALYTLKYLVTFAAVFLVFKYALVNVFALLAGLLVVIIAITLEGFAKATRERKEEK